MGLVPLSVCITGTVWLLDARILVRKDPLDEAGLCVPQAPAGPEPSEPRRSDTAQFCAVIIEQLAMGSWTRRFESTGVSVT